MTPKGRKPNTKERPDPELTPAHVLPEVRLALAMVLQGIKDLRDPDPIRSLDALAWWLTDGPTWVNVLLGATNDLTVFKMAIRGSYEKRLSFSGLSKQGHGQDEPGRT